ncbi:hypothetical protein BS47DRAFT_1485997 [Hydnum rufescens UP504]|uniref:Uncharacterized protein n=1 Tax=Hydnum rufescens UP504 TaxID=1448309 RepID=A0A9P6AY74_9AGAM|nr:hypothetical protein BS47DRAFT_1485997 [Hydnum rufescens UP504]
MPSPLAELEMRYQSHFLPPGVGHHPAVSRNFYVEYSGDGPPASIKLGFAPTSSSSDMYQHSIRYLMTPAIYSRSYMENITSTFDRDVDADPESDVASELVCAVHSPEISALGDAISSPLSGQRSKYDVEEEEIADDDFCGFTDEQLDETYYALSPRARGWQRIRSNWLKGVPSNVPPVSLAHHRSSRSPLLCILEKIDASRKSAPNDLRNADEVAEAETDTCPQEEDRASFFKGYIESRNGAQSMFYCLSFVPRDRLGPKDAAKSRPVERDGSGLGDESGERSFKPRTLLTLSIASPERIHHGVHPLNWEVVSSSSAVVDDESIRTRSICGDSVGMSSKSTSEGRLDEPSSESPSAPGDRGGARPTNDGPTLGTLESALVFLAKERLRLSIRLDYEQSGMEWTSLGDIEHPKRASRKAKTERHRTRLDPLQPIDGDESRPETAAELPSSYDSHDDTFHGPSAV